MIRIKSRSIVEHRLLLNVLEAPLNNSNSHRLILVEHPMVFRNTIHLKECKVSKDPQIIMKYTSNRGDLIKNKAQNLAQATITSVFNQIFLFTKQIKTKAVKLVDKTGQISLGNKQLFLSCKKIETHKITLGIHKSRLKY